MIWLLNSDRGPLGIFDDPFKAIEFCFDPDEMPVWDRNQGTFRGFVNNQIRYTVQALRHNPPPLIMVGPDAEFRARFIDAIRGDIQEATLVQRLLDRSEVAE